MATSVPVVQHVYVQSDLTHPHTPVLDEIADKVREMDNKGAVV